MDNEGARLGLEPGAETVYGTHEDSAMVMSEKVQSLAGSIYQEFERMIQRYDEDVVKTLMPLLVNVLECLDSAYQNNQEQDVELELLREDNEQLVTQYEREKSARKQAEQKLLDTEDLAEAENKELVTRLESLESIVRMLELKHKNSLEHSSRLEEREGELKKEYSKLHDRYTELFKTHVEYMERTKLLMGSTHSQMSSASDRLDINRSRLHPMSRSSGPISYGFASLENSAMLDTETICSPGNSSASGSGPPSLQNEFDNIQTVERSAETDSLHQINQATSPQSDTSPIMPTAPGRTTTKKEQRSANTLYQELSFQDNEESEENEVTGSWVHPGEYASSVNDNFFGMGKEVENLIMENTELLATKNALNIVKDDLIVKVDELTGEIDILREELTAVAQGRNKLRQKVSDLEEELRKTKEQAKQQVSSEQEDEADVPMAQRKRFTRVEMARVLMERNQYKERFMELQDAVRLTEILRASRNVESLDKKSKQSIWKFFSNLFTTPNRPQREPPGPLQRYSSPTHHHSAPGTSEGRLALTGNSSGGGSGSGSSGASHALVVAKNYAEDVSSERAIQRRREQYRQVRAHVKKEDGRLQAYGWSLPGTRNAQGQQNKHAGGVPVPVPIYCRPLAEASPHMKVWCASGVNLNGGYTKDGGCMVGASVFYSNCTPKITEITSPTGNETSELESLDKQITMAMESPDPDVQLSSYVWICTSTHSASTVTVIDAKNPAVILDSFPVCQTHLLCICSVIGALEKDYLLLENSEVTKAGETLEKPGEGPDEVGRVEFIRYVEKKETNDIIENDNENNADGIHNINININNNENIIVMNKTDTNENAVPSSASTTTTTSSSSEDDIKKQDAENGLSGNYDNTVVDPITDTENIKNTQCSFNAEVVDIHVPPMSPIHLNFHTNNANASPNHENNNDINNQYNLLSFSKPVNPILGSPNPLEEPLMSSVAPSMWLGAQNGMLYVHSAIARWRNCLHKVQLPDAVLSIVHVESRVVAALANGKLAIFRRQTDGQWDINNYHLVTLGSPKQSVRCLCIVADKIWAAHRNKIHIVDPITLSIVYTLEAHPRKESQIRQMAATGLGVWVSIRLDSTLRLYHAHTYDHLQDVDIEPYVSKMLGTGKLGFSFVRITALLVSCNRLWIGTGNGVVISVPLADVNSTTGASNKSNFIPRCCMANAQLSFHGHRDAVKFFVSVPKSTPADNPIHISFQKPVMLVMSGGEGYIDFRLGDGDMENSIVLEQNQTIEDRGDKSYLIVWQVNQE